MVTTPAVKRIPRSMCIKAGAFKLGQAKNAIAWARPSRMPPAALCKSAHASERSLRDACFVPPGRRRAKHDVVVGESKAGRPTWFGQSHSHQEGSCSIQPVTHREARPPASSCGARRPLPSWRNCDASARPVRGPLFGTAPTCRGSSIDENPPHRRMCGERRAAGAQDARLE